MKTTTRVTAWAALALVLLAGIDANWALPTLHDSGGLLPAMDDAMIGAVGMCTPTDTLDGSLPDQLVHLLGAQSSRICDPDPGPFQDYRAVKKGQGFLDEIGHGGPVAER